MRGQKVGLIGPNGVGKTTLVRLIIGEESQDEGKLRIGPGVEMGYYEQEQTHIRGSQSVLDEVWSITPQVTENEVRGFLGSFLFRGDDVFKPLNFLSGGEKSRVALAKLVRQGANFLLLDEPTNHLDIESREVFEAALQAYAGTVLVVSHDRYFLDRVMDHVLELHADGCRLWEGGYSRYAAERRAVLAEAPPAAPRGGDDPPAAEAGAPRRKSGGSATKSSGSASATKRSSAAGCGTRKPRSGGWTRSGRRSSWRWRIPVWPPKRLGWPISNPAWRRPSERPPPPSASGNASRCASKHSWTAITDSLLIRYRFLRPPHLCACRRNIRVVYICVENGLSPVGTFALNRWGKSGEADEAARPGRFSERRAVRRKRQEG